MPRSAILERRTTPGEVEAKTKGAKVFIEGYASVFNSRSGNLGGFVEVVERAAFNKTVKEADVRALWNHDSNMILGRRLAGTLELSVDEHGLYYRALAPDTTYARDLLVSLERRDVNQSSFTFFKVDDNWDLTEDSTPQRHLMEVALVDVSPVTFPAYEAATSGIGRTAALEGLSKRSGIEIADLSDMDSIRNAVGKIEPAATTREEPSNVDTRTSPDADKATRIAKAKAELARLAAEEDTIANMLATLDSQQ